MWYTYHIQDVMEDHVINLITNRIFFNLTLRLWDNHQLKRKSE
jgi:hypothetical protein